MVASFVILTRERSDKEESAFYLPAQKKQVPLRHKGLFVPGIFLGQLHFGGLQLFSALWLHRWDQVPR